MGQPGDPGIFWVGYPWVKTQGHPGFNPTHAQHWRRRRETGTESSHRQFRIYVQTSPWCGYATRPRQSCTGARTNMGICISFATIIYKSATMLAKSNGVPVTLLPFSKKQRFVTWSKCEWWGLLQIWQATRIQPERYRWGLRIQGLDT